MGRLGSVPDLIADFAGYSGQAQRLQLERRYKMGARLPIRGCGHYWRAHGC